ncbi:helix-turn-helix domain-containing protein [Micromonospora sp. WMMD1082]|uniref:helix-turn-helix domain-containing protein n=1 Tax=Micromonospora sp. WMMD1082 TaxID=3016104 RepID=UPI002415F2D2|nr:helix-turn-helix domain-containing protein [Micromonospora sp. WMMD1082]MDG4798822.1 helix-turn-helix domain-containing protein [Micromonospora sp. WMMD1082]
MRAGGVKPGQVAEARKDLGRQLAAWRDAAGLTQVQLARRIPYSRSTVANVEVGRHSITRAFWRCADREVGAAGALLAAFEEVDRLVQRQRERVLGRQVRERAGYGLPESGQAPDGCGCGLTVARWAGRETQALREALRMSVRAFAEHLGVTTSTVSEWESRAAAAPLRLASQAVLDQALKLADADARTRFAVLAASAAHGASGGVTGDGGSVRRGSVVAPSRRPERARVAS